MKKMLSFSNLMKVVLILAIFLRGALRDWLIMGITCIWLILVFGFYFKDNGKSLWDKLKTRFNSNKQITDRHGLFRDKNVVKVEEDDVDSDIERAEEEKRRSYYESTQEFLLKNINFRITEKLKQFYPNATWIWETSLTNIESDLKNARIKTSNTGEYNFADVTFLSSGEIRFNMLKITELCEKNEEQVQHTTYDVKNWYETIGFNMIRNTINEIYSHGYRQMEIAEDGTILIRTQNADVECGKIDNMLDKANWNEVIKYLKDDKIIAKVKANKLALSWGGSV